MSLKCHLIVTADNIYKFHVASNRKISYGLIFHVNPPLEIYSFIIPQNQNWSSTAVVIGTLTLCQLVSSADNRVHTGKFV